MKKKLSFLKATTLLIAVMLIAIVILPLTISANNDKKTIISFLYPDEGEDTAIATVYGSTDDLPDTLLAVVLDSNGAEAEEDVSVEWEYDGYDPAVDGEYRYNAVISDGYQYSGTMPYAIVVAPEGPESDEAADITYDTQPTTLEEVKAAIDTYEAEYNAVLKSSGYLAALEVQKPHWQNPVDATIIPNGYNCQLVDWDETFTAEYYTFFPSPETMAFGDGDYVIEPPKGTDITDYFNIICGYIDTKYPNAAIITKDMSNAYGAMWSKEKVDLTWPFRTEIFLHLGHAENITGTVADGMTFTLHNDPNGTNAIGGVGEGLGVYKGRKATENNRTEEDGTYLRNSLVVEFDTYYNTGYEVEDPSYSPHCAVVVPRADIINEIDHKNYFTFDVKQDWVLFKADWYPDDTGGGLLTYSFGGVTKKYQVENIIDMFGSTEVYWGFTGTTGMLTSLQAAVVKILPTPAVKVEKTVKNTAGIDINDGQANVFDTLTYTIRTTATGGSRVSAVTISDELSSYVEYEGDNVRVTTNDSTNPSFTVKPAFKGSTMIVETGHSLEDVDDWIEISFDVKLNGESSGQVVKNTATVSAHRLIPKKTNTTQVEVAAVELSATKTARVLPDWDVDNGTLESPVSIEVGDEIEYAIAVDSSIPIPGTPVNKYDIVFVLDWSGSMNFKYDGSSTSMRIMAKDTILDISQRLFKNYPGSRIAVMGMNCSQNNQHVPSYTYLQIDSAFAGPYQYNAVIQDAFAVSPTYLDDDVPMFLQAATDKLYGNTSTVYGSDLQTCDQRYVNAREDKSRIPVVVLISDYQIDDWSSVYTAADRFKTLLPDGILMTVRTTATNRSVYCSAAYNNYMDETIAKGNGRWAWTKFTEGQTHEEQNELLWKLLVDYVPNDIMVSAIITDVLPEGLAYVDSTGGGVLSGDGRTVTWNISELPKGKTKVTVKTRAIAGGTIINTATVAIEGFGTMVTNKTYHQAMHPEVNLRVKKVIGNIGDYGATNSAAYSELASRPFAISLSGAANGSVTLKHGETSGNMTIVLGKTTDTINISEIVPMEFSEDYKVSAAITHADGRTETQTGRKIKLQAGDNVTITVTSIFEEKPFFKIWAWSKNKFK